MATFYFNCPHCGNLLSAEDEWRGMATQCPYCQKTIIIPVNENFKKNSMPSNSVSRKKQIWKILIPVVSICLIAVVVFLWSCNSSKSAGSSTGEKQQSSSIKTNTIEHSKAKSTESFAYHFRLPVTDDAICLELWSNLPGSIQKWIIVTQAGKRWELHCKEQIPQNIDGKKMYVAQYFFPKAWYLDNLIFDPIASMELTVVNTESSNDLSFVLSDTDKVLFAKLNESITSPSSMNAPVRKIQDDRVFITAKLRNTANQEFIPLMEAVSLAPQSKDSLEKLHNFQHYIRQIQKLEQDMKFYESVPNINDYAKYLDAQNKLRNAKLQILNIKNEALKIYMDHSRDNLQMIMFDVQNKRPQRVYGVNGFNNGQALLNNVKPGKYIVSAAGTIQNIRFTWIFAAEKIEGQPLYLNLTNNQDCLINE